MHETRTSADATSRKFLDPADPGTANQEALLAWLRLQSALCLSPVLARDCLQATGGDPVAALARSGKAPRQGDRVIRGWIRDLGRRGIRALPFTASLYPPALRALPDPPPLLLARGEIGDLQRPSIAIVGARAATGYGRGVAWELAAALGKAGFVVVSGLARGVDAAAHRGALASSGHTVAVMGCGPDRVYPPEHRELADDVAQAGVVVSELSPGRPPAAPHFPLRNRLISGLVQAVVVVEARRRSGSLITARHALDQGREVLVVPGPIDTVHSAGSNALLRDGARPVLDVSDVLQAVSSPFGSAPAGGLVPDPEAKAKPRGRDEAKVYGLLCQDVAHRDALARTLGWPPGRLSVALTDLEIEGWVEGDRDGRLRAIPAARRALRERT